MKGKTFQLFQRLLPEPRISVLTFAPDVYVSSKDLVSSSMATALLFIC